MGLQFRFPPRYRVIWLGLGLLLLASALTASSVFNTPSVKGETALLAVLTIASLGQLLVVILGGFDLSVASVMTLSSAVLVMHSKGSDSKAALAVILALLAAAAVGAVNGVLVGVAGVNPLIATLAVSGVVGAVSLLLTGDGVEISNLVVPKRLTDFAIGFVGPFSKLSLIALGLVAIQALLLTRTRLGRRFVAVGTNPRAARVLGVHVLRYQIASYVIAGVLYGVAGILLGSWVSHPDLTLGDPYLLSTFIVVALGGALFSGGPASVLGAAAGAAFLILLNQYLSLKGYSAGVQSLIGGLVLIVTVALVTALRGRAVFGNSIFLNGLFGSEEVRRYFQSWRQSPGPFSGQKGEK